MAGFALELQELLRRPFSPDEIGLLLITLQRQKRELTIREAAAYLGLAPKSISVMLSNGALARTRRGRVARTSIDAVMLRRKEVA